ncbi:MAG: citrate synthase/methylcitrate synthase [Actinomycetia bacterium]|nr:citrate synthase/methylcitrate synthase [Actinomycetes bacterium]MCP4961739.1 citrate synthase/methylcitrate synthase [Actinomycetes bacterium]
MNQTKQTQKQTQTEPKRVNPGLEGVVVADTRLGGVRGAEGFYHYGPHNAAVLAETRSFEEVWYLFAHGELPSPAELASFRSATAQLRALSPDVERAIAALGPIESMPPMTAARSVLGVVGASLGIDSWIDDPVPAGRRAIELTAAFPSVVAGLWRVRNGHPIVEPDPSLGFAADYLSMITGARPNPDQVAALERYLILTIDHGFNASTFTSRVVASTGADLCGAAVGGLAALSGPLHGGAPSHVLEMFDDVGEVSNAAAWVENALATGRRIMGFGHRVYRADDPRAALLRRTTREMGSRHADLALEMEPIVLDALDRHRPDRELRTNVEYYAATVLDAVGLPRQLFTPTFAVSRIVGWMAHVCEQVEANRLIRPKSHYVGQPPC